MSKELQKFVCKLHSKSTQFICSICKNIICEPHQVTCCGAMSCKACIEAQREDEKPCWSCKHVLDNDCSVPDMRFNKAIVKCPKGYKGCQWKNEFRMLKEHLNPEPAPERQLNGCQFYKIRCLHCNELVRRGKVNDHQRKDCPKRPFTCKYCNYESNYEDIKKNHEATCSKFPIACPKGCGQRISREDANTHECPEDIIDCTFRSVGCTQRVKRKNLESHLKKNSYTHSSWCVSACLRQNQNQPAVNVLNNPLSQPVCSDQQIFPNFNQYMPANQDWPSTPLNPN